jgi:hypothetical protein
MDAGGPGALGAVTPSDAARRRWVPWAVAGAAAVLALVFAVLYWIQRSKANPPGFKPCRPACAPDQVCINGRCETPQFACAQAQDCPLCTDCQQVGTGASAVTRCLPVPDCCGGRTCAVGQYCVSGACTRIPGACASDGDCSAGHRCDPATAACTSASS